MKIGYWGVQTDIKEAIECRGHKAVDLDWHSPDWHRSFSEAKCDRFIWYPHALHSQWFKLLQRALFIEDFLGAKCYPSSRTAYLFQDKLHQKYIFETAGLPIPETIVISYAGEADEFLKKARYPLVVKDIWGYGGYGVKKINDKKEMEGLIKTKRMPKDPLKARPGHYLYAQEMLDIKYEYRVITVGRKMILSYKRESDDFLKNVWRGADVSFDVKGSIEKKVSVWNKGIRPDWCGWDLAEDKKGKIYLIEINPIFGTRVLESRGVNLADYLVEYMLEDNKK